MAVRGPFAEAEPGSLPRQALIDLMLMRDFLGARDEALRALFGVSLKRNPLRDEIIRSCVIEFGLGNSRRVSYYQAHCRDFGSPSAVKNEIRTLATLRVLVTRPDPENVSALLVLPTKRLIRFFAQTMGSLEADLQELLFVRKVRMESDFQKQKSGQIMSK